MRKILHLDMDCFYAAVEIRERPELAGLPVAVGGGSRRGVITTCSYEARKFGVRSAMPGFKARELCPQLVFLPVRFDLYRAESAKIRALMLEYTPLVEPLSLDEAYLDVSSSDRYAWDIAKELRKRIFEQTRLTASAGVAPNKMLAKIASDWKKPNGQFAITPEQVDAFMAGLPIAKLHGIGPKTADKLTRRGLRTCGDLQSLSLPDLSRLFGKWGAELYHLCRGRDDREIEPNRVRKSLSNEETYMENLTTLKACQEALGVLVGELAKEVRSKTPDRAVRKLFVKVKYADFTQATREGPGQRPDPELYHPLLASAWNGKAVRLLGAGVRFAEPEAEASERQIALDLLFPEM